MSCSALKEKVYGVVFYAKEVEYTPDVQDHFIVKRNSALNALLPTASFPFNASETTKKCLLHPLHRWVMSLYCRCLEYMFIVIRVQWLIQLAHLFYGDLTYLLEVTTDDALEGKLILPLGFRDTLLFAGG